MRRIIASILAFSYLLLFVVEVGAQKHSMQRVSDQSQEILVESLADGCEIPCCDCPISVTVQARVDKSSSAVSLHFDHLLIVDQLIRDNSTAASTKLKVYPPRPKRLVKATPIYLQQQSFLI